jgi:hypothetical protein
MADAREKVTLKRQHHLAAQAGSRPHRPHRRTRSMVRQRNPPYASWRVRQ